MVVQRRDGPRRLRGDDNDDDDRHWDSGTDPEQSVGAVVVMSAGRWYSPVSDTDAVSLSTVVDAQSNQVFRSTSQHITSTLTDTTCLVA